METKQVDPTPKQNQSQAGGSCSRKVFVSRTRVYKQTHFHAQTHLETCHTSLMFLSKSWHQPNHTICFLLFSSCDSTHTSGFEHTDEDKLKHVRTETMGTHPWLSSRIHMKTSGSICIELLQQKWPPLIRCKKL